MKLKGTPVIIGERFKFLLLQVLLFFMAHRVREEFLKRKENN